MIPIARPDLSEAEIVAAVSVLSSGTLTGGEEVALFEEEFSALVDGRASVAVNSGTAALVTCLAALGIGPGDEVIVPAFSFGATANAVLLVGATPVLADIDSEVYCLCPNSVRERITGRTAAILPVHLYGHPAPMGALLEIAEQNELLVVEDAAQAHLAGCDGVPCGAFGDAAAFSFHATKNMTTGEGGMAVFKDRQVAEQAAVVRNQGMDATYQYRIAGYNFRMPAVAAAIGRVQLKRLPELNQQRLDNAQWYDRNVTSCQTPAVLPGAEHVYHQYTLSSGQRDALLDRLRRSGVDARVYYPQPLSDFPIYGHDGYPVANAEMAAQSVLSIPVGAHVGEVERSRIVEAVES